MDTLTFWHDANKLIQQIAEHKNSDKFYITIVPSHLLYTGTFAKDNYLVPTAPAWECIQDALRQVFHFKLMLKSYISTLAHSDCVPTQARGNKKNVYLML